VAVEPGQGGQCPAFDFDDRDPKAGCVEDEPLERLAALRDDEQATCGPSSDERLLDRAASRDELFVLGEEIRRGNGRSERRRSARGRLPLAVRSRPVESGSVEAGSVAAGWP
jgi:hypothetical protein